MTTAYPDDAGTMHGKLGPFTLSASPTDHACFTGAVASSTADTFNTWAP